MGEEEDGLPRMGEDDEEEEDGKPPEKERRRGDDAAESSERLPVEDEKEVEEEKTRLDLRGECSRCSRRRLTFSRKPRNCSTPSSLSTAANWTY